MKTEAVVISTDGRFAVVETERTSACEGCHKSEDGKGCSVCSLMGGDRKLSARAKNTVGAQAGDRVMIESQTGRMLYYAVLVFLLPVVISLLCYAGASLLTAQMAWKLMGAAMGFCLTFAGLFLYSRAVQKKRCDIEIIEIIEITKRSQK